MSTMLSLRLAQSSVTKGALQVDVSKDAGVHACGCLLCLQILGMNPTCMSAVDPCCQILISILLLCADPDTCWVPFPRHTGFEGYWEKVGGWRNTGDHASAGAV
jgi:hypothetical protein